MGERNGAQMGDRWLCLIGLAVRQHESRLQRHRHPEGAPAGAGADPVLSVALLGGAARIVAAVMGYRVLMRWRGREGGLAAARDMERGRGGKRQQQEKDKPMPRCGRLPTPPWQPPPCPKPLHRYSFGRPTDRPTLSII